MFGSTKGEAPLPNKFFLITYTKNLTFPAFLHAVPDAVDFYLRNGFEFMLPNMEPFHSIDSEFTPMFLALYELHINFDE